MFSFFVPFFFSFAPWGYERRGVPFITRDRTRSLEDFVGPQNKTTMNNKSIKSIGATLLLPSAVCAKMEAAPIDAHIGEIGIPMSKMKLRLVLVSALALIAFASSRVARADAVTVWNTIASTKIGTNAGQPPAVSALGFAMVQEAVYEAVNE